MESMGVGLTDAVGLADLPQGRALLVKMGFDPTAPDLHLGHAVGLLALRRMQNLGHQVALVVGDFTAAIGDPTGRNDTRPSLDKATIDTNAASYAKQAMRILDESKTRVMFNSVWLEKLGASGLIRLASKTTVSQMLAREDFSKRYKEGAAIGAHELLYPLLQARDSVEIMPDIEFGGTDQRFNLLMGRELMREAGQKPQACAMVPLLVGLDGTRKMSKSLGNHIGLAESPQDVFAKTMSVSDATMRQWIAALGVSMEDEEAAPMEMKKQLGCWIVERLSGPQEALAARRSWEKSRQGGDWSELAETLKVAVTAEGSAWATLLRDWGWESSAQQARQRIAQGALRLNGEKVLDAKAKVYPGDCGLVRYGAKKAASMVAVLGSNPGDYIQHAPKATP